MGAGTTGNLFYWGGRDVIVTTSADLVHPPLGPASITMVPEPATIGLLALGLGALPSRIG